MGPRILLATTVNWPSAARLAGAFAGVGAAVDGLFPAGHMMGKSRFVSGQHIYRALFPQQSLARAIECSAPDLIVPCDDRALTLLLTLHSRTPRGATAALIERSLGRIENYSLLIARSTFIDAARAVGIAAPETVHFSSENELEAALSLIGYPAVLKIDGSWGGDGVAIARNRDQARESFGRLSAVPSRLRNAVRAVRRCDAHFLRAALHPPQLAMSLQRFISGKPATSAFACWKGRVLATIHMDVLETLGATGPASVMRRVECQEMELAAVRLAARFGLSGLHGLDFIRDADGKAHLIETNPRATQASAFALGPGHDLAAALAGCLSPGVGGARPATTDDPVIALFPQEWRRNPKSDWLHSAYLDAPWDDPAVLRACLEPGEPPPQQPRWAGVAPVGPMLLRGDRVENP